MDNHTWALIAILCALKLLEHEWHRIVLIIPIIVHEAFLDEVETLASFSLMLLSYVLRGVSKTGLFEEVILGALVEARVTVVKVGVQELHGLFVVGDTQLVQLVNQGLLL